MATDRKDTKVTRLDLRIPNDIYAQIEEIAKANNAPSHHITGNIILSPTLLKLISLGIRSLSDNYSELADISQPSDTSSSRIDAIEGELAAVKKSLIELSDKLSDKLPDTLSDKLPDRREKKEKMGQSSPPSPTTATTTRKLTSKDDYPEWVTADKRSHYNKLAGNSGLLASVTKIIELSGNTDEIAKEVVELGFVNEKGGKLGNTAIYKLKSVVKVLNKAEADDN